MRIVTIAALVFTATGAASANDSIATVGVGGLRFITSENVQMLSEDLYVSTDEVRVIYEFRNRGDADEKVLVAFPMPDIEGSGDFMVRIPTEADDNIFGFTTTFDGRRVRAKLHQYAFAVGIDRTDTLRDLGVPLLPYGRETTDALNALDPADQEQLMKLGLVIPMRYDAGQGWQTDYTPVWTLRSTYSWEATFPVGETVEVVHTYKPSVGGTVAVTFLAAPYGNYDPATTYMKRYCTDDSFIRAVKRAMANPDDPYSAPFTEAWLSYIWSTGGNWSGPIGRFHLTIDKGSAQNLVSFCWDGEVEKTSSTTFEMEAKDWFPPYDRELDILILKPTQQ